MLLASSGVSRASSKTYIDDYFSVQLRTGNGTSQSVTTGFQPDLIWTKSRSAATGHRLVDSTRGAGNSLESNSTLAQQSEATGITAINSSGYSVGADSDYNTSGAAYVDWCWKKAPKFFDVVTYIGDGTDNRQVPHSLGVAPGKVIVKKVTANTGATAGWITWHRGIGDGYLYLNTTNSVFSGANTIFGSPYSAPTSSVFSVGLNLNASTETYVAYLFAHDPSADGIIQCGSLTEASEVTLGWEPQFVIIKRTDSTGNWRMSDSVRGSIQSTTVELGGVGQVLYSDLSNAEAQNNTAAYAPTSTGFKFTGGVPGSTYVYLAIRRSNKPPTSGTQVFQPVTYTGTSSENRLVNTGIVTDLSFIRNRTQSGAGFEGMVVGSRLTGDAWMKTALTQAENTFQGLQTPTVSFGNSFSAMNGFGVQSGAMISNASYGNLNINLSSNIAHAFKRAKGFMDVVCYTGTGSNRTVAHNLGVAPELIIVKTRTVAHSWAVYPNDPTKILFLNNTDPIYTHINYWNNTTPTNSVFTVGTVYETNRVGIPFVAYLFATLPGISKVGNYIGNGSSQTINCGFSTGARFILIKRTDSTGDWYIWDTARGIVSANDPHLSLNTTVAEITTDDSVDPDNTGFIVNQVAATNINVNNATYIYLAIA